MADPSPGPLLERRAASRGENRAWLPRLVRYRWILWLVLLAMLAIGFDFKTPAAQFKSLQEKNNQQDTTIANLSRYVRALVIGQCLDRSRRETDLMGLNCSRLLGSGPIP